MQHACAARRAKRVHTVCRKQRFLKRARHAFRNPQQAGGRGYLDRKHVRRLHAAAGIIQAKVRLGFFRVAWAPHKASPCDSIVLQQTILNVVEWYTASCDHVILCEVS